MGIRTIFDGRFLASCFTTIHSIIHRSTIIEVLLLPIAFGYVYTANYMEQSSRFHFHRIHITLDYINRPRWRRSIYVILIIIISNGNQRADNVYFLLFVKIITAARVRRHKRVSLDAHACEGRRENGTTDFVQLFYYHFFFSTYLPPVSPYAYARTTHIFTFVRRRRCVFTHLAFICVVNCNRCRNEIIAMMKRTCFWENERR